MMKAISLMHKIDTSASRSELISKIKQINSSKNSNVELALEADSKILDSTIGYCYDLIREINKLNKRLSEAIEPTLKLNIKEEIKQLISLIEVVNEILALYKTKNKESIEPLKNKITYVLNHPFETVEI